jgi:hypothetical protein
LRVAPVKNDPDVVVVFTLVKALPTVGVTAVTAVPVCPLTPFTTLVDVVPRLAPVRNDPGVVCTPVTALAKVGDTAVTTVVPGVPLTPLTTLAKVEVTPVTHVAAEAEDNSPALRLPTVSAERSVWFEADDNSANRTAARRGIIMCFGLAILPPLRVWTLQKLFGKTLQKAWITTVHSVEFVVAVVRKQQSGLPGRTLARTRKHGTKV